MKSPSEEKLVKVTDVDKYINKTPEQIIIFGARGIVPLFTYIEDNNTIFRLYKDKTDKSFVKHAKDGMRGMYCLSYSDINAISNNGRAELIDLQSDRFLTDYEACPFVNEHSEYYASGLYDKNVWYGDLFSSQILSEMQNGTYLHRVSLCQ